jgi:hypothetical protein
LLPIVFDVGSTEGAGKGKVQVRIAKDLVNWLDHHAEVNKDGFTSRALVAEDAIRFYRDHQDEKARRRNESDESFRPRKHA